MRKRRIAAATDAGWGPAVLAAVRVELARQGDDPPELTRSWSAVEQGRPVVHLVYRHPWWDFTTGLRRYVDVPTPDWTREQTPQLVADWIVLEDLTTPLGKVSRSMTPDGEGVWWWGDEPLPGDARRRGPAPVVMDGAGQPVHAGSADCRQRGRGTCRLRERLAQLLNR